MNAAHTVAVVGTGVTYSCSRDGAPRGAASELAVVHGDQGIPRSGDAET